jgi:lysophospholipase L1-like esterase
MRDVGSLIKSAGRYYRAVALLVLNALVILVGLEFVSKAAMMVRTSLLAREETVLDPRAKSSYYLSEKWASEYWQEFSRSREQQYHAYTVWRRAPFKGKTINVDGQGIRLTPGSDCSPNALKIFAFGGSPMWGTGSPDWSTIPAYLEADFQKLRGGPVCVQNFGESGYVSTQSVIELVLQLHAGNIPDIAIFGDGGNDIYTGYQSGKSGVHENLPLIAAKMQGTGQPGLATQLLESLSGYRLVRNQLERFSAPATRKLLTYETAGIDRGQLSKAIVQTYIGNYEVVDSLAQKYGFKHFFFWPPYISRGNKQLTDEEKKFLNSGDPSLEKLYDSVYEMMEPLMPKYDHLHSLTDVFDDQKALLWLDDTHVTPVGNELIARRMVHIIEGVRSKSSPRPSSSIISNEY